MSATFFGKQTDGKFIAEKTIIIESLNQFTQTSDIICTFHVLIKVS